MAFGRICDLCKLDRVGKHFPRLGEGRKERRKKICVTPSGQDIPSLIFGDLEKGLNRDALKSTHAVEVRR